MKAHAAYCEDGSLLLEWGDAEQRFGISIEEDLDTSSWYFVSKRDDFEGGPLPDELLALLKEKQ